jgi:uncharacterized membrane protein
MPHFCYPFMKEWGSCICGTCMVLFSLFCLILAFMFFKRLYPNNSNKSEQKDNIDNPEVILNNRYVKGEIDRTEFLEKKKDIEG